MVPFDTHGDCDGDGALVDITDHSPYRDVGDGGRCSGLVPNSNPSMSLRHLFRFLTFRLRHLGHVREPARQSRTLGTVEIAASLCSSPRQIKVPFVCTEAPVVCTEGLGRCYGRLLGNHPEPPPASAWRRLRRQVQRQQRCIIATAVADGIGVLRLGLGNVAPTQIIRGEMSERVVQQ